MKADLIVAGGGGGGGYGARGICLVRGTGPRSSFLLPYHVGQLSQDLIRISSVHCGHCVVWRERHSRSQIHLTSLMLKNYPLYTKPVSWKSIKCHPEKAPRTALSVLSS